MHSPKESGQNRDDWMIDGNINITVKKMGQYFLDTQRQSRAAVFAGNSISVLKERDFDSISCRMDNKSSLLEYIYTALEGPWAKVLPK